MSKEEFSAFLTWTDLGSTKHQTAAEVDDAFKVCTQAMKDFGANIASIPVDNAARGMATLLAKKIGKHVVVSRDPAHCIDLLSKDLANTLVVTRVMNEAKEVRDFVKIDRIDSIRIEASARGSLEDSCTAVTMCETRMNLCFDFIQAARRQHDFLKLLWGNSAFQVWYKERSTKVQDSTRAILDRCNEQARWERMDVLLSSLLKHFKVVHGLCSREDFPLSCYVLLIQALRNDINRGLKENDGRFQALLGEGSIREIALMIRSRFNMDGRDTEGRKVGLLDRHHLMCFLVDPFSYEWRSTFLLDTNRGELVTEMIQKFVPLDEDGTGKARARVMQDFMVSLIYFRCLFISCYTHL